MRIPAVRPGRAAAAAAALAALAGATIVVEAAQKRPTVELVSAGFDGFPPAGTSVDPALSASGRYVAFASSAPDVADGLGSAGFGEFDLYVRDRTSRRTIRVTVEPQGARTRGCSERPAISANGRWVSFESDRSALVPGDLNSSTDVFVRDVRAGTTARVSLGAGGQEADGRSTSATISGNGRFVAFASGATNLTSEDSRGVVQVYVHDRRTGATELVSLSTDGVAGGANSGQPSISDDGRYVAFVAFGDDLDPADGNGFADVYVRDRVRKRTFRASLTADGREPDDACDEPAISGNGRYVVFTSRSARFGTNPDGWEQVVLRDTLKSTTARISGTSPADPAAGRCSAPRITANGRYVAFTSEAANLVADDGNGASDVFLADVRTSVVRRVSLDALGGEGAGFCSRSALTPDGKLVAFDSSSEVVVGGDQNQASDVFVRPVR